MRLYRKSMLFCIAGGFGVVNAQETSKELSEFSGLKEKTSYHVRISADYLYWKLSEDIPSIGNCTTSDTTLGLNDTAITNVFSGSSVPISINPGYKSGFQIGLGYDVQGWDAWNIVAGYSWYQNKSSNSITAASNQSFVIGSVFTPTKFDGRLIITQDLFSSFSFDYNSVFLALKKEISVKNLEAGIEMGLRTLWMGQKLDITSPSLSYIVPSSSFFVVNEGPFVSGIQQKSWGIGPQFTINANWLLPYSLKILGVLGFSAPYTQYTTQKSFAATFESRVNTSVPSYSTLRAITEASLGLGWDMFFGANHSYYFNVTASYDFNVFWNYTSIGNMDTTGNVYLQGLNLKAQFGF